MTRFQERLFRNFKSPFLHGIAFKKFEKGNYKKASEILEYLCKFNEDEENREYTYRTLGHCYLCMGNINRAIKWLSKSYGCGSFATTIFNSLKQFIVHQN